VKARSLQPHVWGPRSAGQFNNACQLSPVRPYQPTSTLAVQSRPRLRIPQDLRVTGDSKDLSLSWPRSYSCATRATACRPSACKDDSERPSLRGGHRRRPVGACLLGQRCAPLLGVIVAHLCLGRGYPVRYPVQHRVPQHTSPGLGTRLSGLSPTAPLLRLFQSPPAALNAKALVSTYRARPYARVGRPVFATT